MATEAPSFPVFRLDPGAIRPAELDRLVEILTQGGAVDTETARLTLPHCRVLIVATTAEDEFIGVGAVKPPRAAYTAGIQNDSGIKFDVNTPELGYVAVAKRSRQPRRNGLNPRVSRGSCRKGVSRGVSEPTWRGSDINEFNGLSAV